MDAEDGVARFGKILFNGNCAGCHGIDGEYETDMIGPTLRSPQLLSLMDSRHFYETMVDGRAGTAMPAWGFLSPVNLADLMAYTDAWRDETIARRSFDRAVSLAVPAAWDAASFMRHCALRVTVMMPKAGSVRRSSHLKFIKLADNRLLHKNA